MIVLNLMCAAGHRFEGWFASVDVYEAQVTRHEVGCPQCMDTAISRLPTGPRVKRASATDVAHVPSREIIERTLLQRLGKLAATAEDVGTRFPEEARRIHYEEVPQRAIRGTASLADTVELLEEGIAVLPAPTLPEETKH